MQVVWLTGAIALAAIVAPAQSMPIEARAAVEATPQDSVERVDALLQEVRVLLRFDLRQAAERSEQATQLAAQLHDDVRHALALSLQSRATVDLTGPDDARRMLEAARRALPEGAPLAARAEVALAGALLNWTLDQPRECLRDLRAAFDYAEQCEAFAVLFRANLVAWNVVDLGNDRSQEVAALAEIAKKSGDRGQLLEARLLATISSETTAGEPDILATLRELRDDAHALGDRLREGYVLSLIASRLAAQDTRLADEHARQALAVYELHGSRERIATTLDYLARVAIAEDRYDDACALSDRAIAQLDGMGTTHALAAVHDTAANAAVLANRGDDARRHREEALRLEREFSKRRNADRAGIWHDTAALGRDIGKLKHSYQAQLHDMDRQLKNVLLIGGGVLLLLASGSLLLLFRAKRRTDVANARLQHEIAAAEAAEADRRALEENMRQLERLDSIGMLAGGFAHDFNNILVGIRGNAQLTLFSDELSDEQRELLDQIISSSDRAAGLCKDILAYAHSGSTPRSQIDVREVLSGVLPLARSGFGGAVDLEVVLGDEPCPIYVDRAQLEQVFLNVLVNAGDAMGKRGTIHVRVFEQHLPGEAPSGHWFGEFTGEERDCVAVSFRDSGQGMTPETIRRIFDPFFSTRFPGRGLGLAATYGILRRHGGVVCVESEPGKGSTFTVYLPRSTERDGETPEPVVVLEPRRHQKPQPAEALLLVVDDDQQVLRVTDRALRNAGYATVAADGAATALQLAEQHGDRITMAVIDYTMPDVDGAELSKQLAERIPHLRTLLMSGQSEQVVRSAAPDCALLGKPFDTRALIDAVRSLQNRSAATSD